ncbi:MAG TPA: HNH endonuclease signature motif containing protein [Chitinophagaceae bacterium]|nr:HNH endonuclease signature motif containing protein [Chitinophagaceae bacterium]
MQKILFLLFTLSLLSSSSIFSQHLKKDGTPDMRYKENKISDTTISSTHKSKIKDTQNSTTVPQFEPNSKYNYTVKRGANGKIHRSNAARLAFMKQTGYPKGRPGYIIDHIIPLKRGGCDCPANMQWQTIADAKAKDKVEMP